MTHIYSGSIIKFQQRLYYTANYLKKRKFFEYAFNFQLCKMFLMKIINDKAKRLTATI